MIAWSETPRRPIGDAVAAVARAAGAAYLDTSLDAQPRPDSRPLLTRGIASYGALDLDAAIAALDAAAAIVDRTGAASLDPTALADLFIYRALAHGSRGEEARAWDDLVIAATLAPVRVLDPASYPPRIVERFERAKAHVVAAPRATLRLVGPPACQVRLDAEPVALRELEVVPGVHWLDATCDGHAAIRRRIVVDRSPLEIAIAGAAIVPPDDAALLVQARTVSARAFVVVIVRGSLAVIRRIGADGRELDRLSLATDDPREIAGAVSRLLAPRATGSTPWHRSRWVWAGAGAAVAAALVLPFALRAGSDAPTVTVRPSGAPSPW